MTDLPLLTWSAALSVPVAAGTAAEDGAAEVGADPYPDPDPDEVEGAAAGVVGAAAGVLLVPHALIPATAPVSAVAITMVRKDFTVGFLQLGAVAGQWKRRSGWKRSADGEGAVHRGVDGAVHRVGAWFGGCHQRAGGGGVEAAGVEAVVISGHRVRLAVTVHESELLPR